MKIAFIGDQHGNTSNFYQLLDYIEQKDNPDIYIQVGDFGLMGPNFLNYLFKINKKLEQMNKQMYFIDGNHENHIWLRERNPQLASHIKYQERGSMMTINDKNILFMGGAFSIDRMYRTLNKTYWLEELITDEELEKALQYDKVDILISHDVTANVFDMYLKHFLLPLKQDSESNNNRKKLYEIYDKYKPEYIIHGHYHYNYEYEIDGTNVIGLSCDEEPLDEQYFILTI